VIAPAIDRAGPLRHELAGEAKDDLAVAFVMLVEYDARV